MSFAVPGLLCLAYGFLLVRMGLRFRFRRFSECLLALSLAIGFGLGVFSVTYLLSLLLQNPRPIVVDGVTLVLLGGGLLWCRYRGVSAHGGVEQDRTAAPAWLYRLLTGAFVTALCAALYSAVTRALAYPQGDGWDAFSIWNLHARFLFRGGTHWRDGFTSLLPWSHPDYPLLLPSAVAHFWSYLGHDNPIVPAMIGFLFTFGTVALQFSALSILRGRTTAMFGTIALLATPSFIELGTSQYADVPLSFFYLTTVALLCLHDDYGRGGPSASAGLLILSSVAAALAAWTKNEGLLFLCSILVARLFILARGGSFPAASPRVRMVAPMLIVIVPALLLIAGFKHYIAGPGDLFSDPTTMLHKLLDPARYWAITKWSFKGFFRFGRWWVIPAPLLMIGFCLATGRDERAASRAGIRTSILALCLTLVGYFAIYLITPYDIYWHLRFSITRLFLQLWPSAIFIVFLLGGSGALSDRDRVKTL
jgi:hypothetical protein